jgi:hypothetical protein
MPRLMLFRSRHTTRCAGLVILMCLARLSTAASADASTSPWAVQQVPHPHVAAATTLYDVSCRSTAWCMAVGGTLGSGGGQLSADRWNGHAWSLLHPPVPRHTSKSDLGGISCPSVRLCVAVGAFVRGGRMSPVEARWNGRRWTLSVLPKPPSAPDAELESISCVSARFCFAVGASWDGGGDQQAFAEQMRGSKWSLRPLSAAGTSSGVTALDGVSCRSSTLCTTVGYDDAGDGVALRWNASGWHFQFDSNPNLWAGSELFSISCVSATFCAAAGGGNDSSSAGAVSNAGVAELWNGLKWTVREDADPTNTNNYDLFAVSCSSRTACLAVGFIAERWNGQSWTLEQIPDPITLLGVSCPTRTLCIAVGNSTPRHGPVLPVVMRWSGAERQNRAPIHTTCADRRSCATPALTRRRRRGRYLPRHHSAASPTMTERVRSASTR